MPEFTVTWVINEDADTPEQAARQARARLLDPDSIADVFEVGEVGNNEPSVVLDLSRIDGRPVD